MKAKVLGYFYQGGFKTPRDALAFDMGTSLKFSKTAKEALKNFEWWNKNNPKILKPKIFKVTIEYIKVKHPLKLLKGCK